jgi:hypothetical protein
MTANDKAEALAARELQADVQNVSRKSLGTCSVSVWRSVRRWPQRIAAIAETDSDTYVASRDLATFERLLKDAKPRLDCVEDFCNFFKCYGPSYYEILSDKESDFLMREIQSVWEPPSYSNGEVTIYCNDFTDGTCIKIVVDSDFSLRDEPIGKGIEMLDR